jgi:antitoxin (DNA-binding transcriptional repressor) of toxin-antitoxin stability system
MKSITVAQLRQNPTEALVEVQAGESYLITRHRLAIAQLVPVGTAPLDVIPAKSPGGSRLSQRPRRRTYDEAEATLADVRAEW